MACDRPGVILNDRALHRPWTGVAHYVAQLLAGLAEHAPDIRVLPFYQTLRGQRRRPSGVRGGGGNSGQQEKPWYPWFRRVMQDTYHVAMETAGLIAGCRLYHEPNHIPGPWPGPIVTTVHDLSVLRFPHWHPAHRVRWYDREFLPALSRSHHFITVSEFSRREMIELLGVSEDRITAIPLGPRAVFHPRETDDVRRWLGQHHLPEDYLLFVGTIEPRKNVRGVLAAYAELPPDVRRRTSLLLAGMSGWGDDQVEQLVRQRRLGDNVRLLGYVDEEALAYLYAGARALVWPSFFEGFGLPPLECMASGTPVITSNRSSIPEVVGDAVMLVEPEDVEAIRSAMARVSADVPFARALAERGLARSRAFSWATCAARHAEIYRQFAAD